MDLPLRVTSCYFLNLIFPSRRSFSASSRISWMWSLRMICFDSGVRMFIIIPFGFSHYEVCKPCGNFCKKGESLWGSSLRGLLLRGGREYGQHGLVSLDALLRLADGAADLAGQATRGHAHGSSFRRCSLIIEHVESAKKMSWLLEVFSSIYTRQGPRRLVVGRDSFSL